MENRNTFFLFPKESFMKTFGNLKKNRFNYLINYHKSNYIYKYLNFKIRHSAEVSRFTIT